MSPILELVQMEYIKEIVESGFNLTLAAERLYVSQSALSQFIKKFEANNEVNLFIRHNGRIVDLTELGYELYDRIIVILNKYYQLEDLVLEESKQQQGRIKIGIHPTILRLFFTKFIPSFMLNNPDADIDIVESESVPARDDLEDERLDMAIIMEPTELDLKDFEQHPLVKTEASVIVNKDHPLNKLDKISWEDLNDFNLITYSEEEPIYKQLQDKVKQHKLDCEILFTSNSFDFLIETCSNSELVAILPTVNLDQFNENLDFVGVASKSMESPILSIPMLVRPKKERYSKIASFFYNSLLEYFYLDDLSLRYNFLTEETNEEGV